MTRRNSDCWDPLPIPLLTLQISNPPALWTARGSRSIPLASVAQVGRRPVAIRFIIWASSLAACKPFPLEAGPPPPPRPAQPRPRLRPVSPSTPYFEIHRCLPRRQALPSPAQYSPPIHGKALASIRTWLSASSAYCWPPKLRPQCAKLPAVLRLILADQQPIFRWRRCDSSNHARSNWGVRIF